MLDKARDRGAYDELIQGDLAVVLDRYIGAFDLAVSADVLIYVGNLEPAFRACAKAIAPGGIFAFTTEVCAGDGYTLDSTGRYLHSGTYIERLARQHGFLIAHAATIVVSLSGRRAGRCQPASAASRGPMKTRGASAPRVACCESLRTLRSVASVAFATSPARPMRRRPEAAPEARARRSVLERS